MLTAGVLWIAIGAAPLFEGPAVDGIARLALAPTALLVIGLAAFTTAVSRAGLVIVVLLALVITSVGAAGAHRFAMAALGLCLIATPIVTLGRPTGRDPESFAGTTAQTTWVGCGLIAVGLASGFDLASAAFVTNLHQLTIVTGAALVALHIVETQVVVGDDPVSGALTTALGDALGAELVGIAFPSALSGRDPTDEPAAWLDPTGRPFVVCDAGELVRADDGMPLAWLDPPLEPGQHTGELQQLLDIAGKVARLRAELRARAIDITESTERLQTAVERERARLAAVLDDGPIATLDQATRLLAAQHVDPRLLDRLAMAERALRDVVDGIEPIADVSDLAQAVNHLAERFDASCEIDIDGELDRTTTRLLWFTCTEGVANALKHSPGAPLQVVVRVANGSYELLVVDHGAGGADINGEGLARLRERAAECGARLTVDSPTGKGTRLSLVGPIDTWYHRPGYPQAPMTLGATLQTIDP